MSERHLIASVALVDDRLKLTVTEPYLGNPVDPTSDQPEGSAGTVELSLTLLTQLIDQCNAGRVAVTELGELAGQLDMIAGAMEADAPKAARGRRRRAILSRAAAYRQAADLTRVRMRRVDYR